MPILNFEEIRKHLKDIELGARNEDNPNIKNAADEMRRLAVIEFAVQAADSIIIDFSSGSVEETDHLTAEVTFRFMGKVSGALNAKLLIKDLKVREGKDWKNAV